MALVHEVTRASGPDRENHAVRALEIRFEGNIASVFVPFAKNNTKIPKSAPSVE
jgi:hypothetical protein